MSMDEDLLADFVVEASEHLADIENQFLSIEEAGDQVDVDLVNEIFRGVHSIKGCAGFLGLKRVNELAHALENVLNKLRNLELTPDSAMVDTMLNAADMLRNMIGDVHAYENADVSDHTTALDAIAEGGQAKSEPEEQPAEAPAADEQPAGEKAADEKASDQPAAAEQGTVPEAPAEPVQEPATPAAAPTPKPAAAVSTKESKPVDSNIRVSLGLLDRLMNLAGELVLSRNQLMQAITSNQRQGLDAIAARVDQVTSELQESIVQTRMQQIGTVFSRFPRIVRDLSGQLGKHCDLVIEGKEVEIDKTIIEAIGDPLTHLVRNSVDHGVETPEVRVANGKSETGTLNLRASYQAGKVRIEIEDDGGGIDPSKLKAKAVAKGVLTAEQADQLSERDAVRLIFHPGFSTAEKVTDVSGRGVGMDVVRTNITKLGGSVDVESVVGKGTNIVITLPLTLAIIPSLIVYGGGERYAIPQVNISELVRVRANEVDKRIGRVKNAEVLRLRGKLLPLIGLDRAMGQPTSNEERAEHAMNIIVVETGQAQFGLIVDSLHDSEEIVVKPLGKHLQTIDCLSGATILGDGHVALILDVAGIAAQQSIHDHEALTDSNSDLAAGDHRLETQPVLLFTNHPEEHFALSMEVVARIERVRSEQIDSVGGQELLQFRDATVPLIRLENYVSTTPSEPADRLYVVVFRVGGHELGLIVPQVQDIRDVSTDVDTSTFRQEGVIGSFVVDKHPTRLLNMFELAQIAHPAWFAEHEEELNADASRKRLLLAEDSSFFRQQVRNTLESHGYEVVGCEDGQDAWETLTSGEYEFDGIVTDIEMPRMDGFQFTEHVRDSQWRDLPIVALTSLSGSADVARGKAVGIDEYQIKMDQEQLLKAITSLLSKGRSTHHSELQIS
ncbi:MAG: chemotaxis protein CheW [Planctomycetota bacterium]